MPRTSTLLAQELPVEIPVGLPSTLLERRPDVRMAEQQVRAANAEIGVAVGDFFPRIGLTAFYGGASTELHNLVSSGANMWSVAASTAGPLFTGGRLTGRYRQAKAACEEAKLQYQDTALGAFREVSDALISHRRFDEERVEQAEAVNAGREAVAVATDRYKEGKASYYEVLEAQQQLFPAENALSQIEAGRRLAVVQLYKALGGGWSLKDSEWSGADRGSAVLSKSRQRCALISVMEREKQSQLILISPRKYCWRLRKSSVSRRNRNPRILTCRRRWWRPRTRGGIESWAETGKPYARRPSYARYPVLPDQAIPYRLLPK